MAGRRGTVLTLRPVALTTGLVACAYLATLAPTTTHAGRAAGQHSPGHGPPRAGTAVTAGSVRAEPPPVPTQDGASLARGPLDVGSPLRQVDCRKHKCVALTFDDGPAAGTARLLDALAQHGAKATFFLVGESVERYPQLARREAAEGHELANHTYSHPNLRASPHARITHELRHTQEVIRRTTGVTPALMRPPFGATDERVAAIAKRMGLAQILWSLDPFDWRIGDSEKVERNVVTGARDGSIVLMHDIHPTTVAAEPGILRRLGSKGYFFVTVSELYGNPLVPGKKHFGR